ncbi:hypothetical protein MUP56_01355 [Patescibacteria group bacterium]|nr:hypothetical protein [Patescibacteria group bacterium]
MGKPGIEAVPVCCSTCIHVDKSDSALGPFHGKCLGLPFQPEYGFFEPRLVKPVLLVGTPFDNALFQNLYKLASQIAKGDTCWELNPQSVVEIPKQQSTFSGDASDVNNS